MKATILILVNNVQVSDLIAFELSRENYYIIRASNGKDGLRLLHTRQPDIALVDLPEGMDTDSFDVYSQSKEEGLDTEILTFVTEDEVDLAKNLRMEHIIKPFSIHDLMERINNLSLRTEQIQRPMLQVLGSITLDMKRGVVSKDGVPIEMSLNDYNLFSILASQPGTAFSREELMATAWGYTNYLGDTGMVDVAIHRLRIRIEDDPSNPQFIMTRRGVGYFFAIQ